MVFLWFYIGFSYLFTAGFICSSYDIDGENAVKLTFVYLFSPVVLPFVIGIKLGRK